MTLNTHLLGVIYHAWTNKLLYISPVGHLITSYAATALEHHQYADNTQLFLAMWTSTICAGLSTLEACTHDVKRWFAENDLLLNADKSEVIMIGTSAQLRAASTVNTVVVAEANLTLSPKQFARCDPRLQTVVRRATITSELFGTSGDYYHLTWRGRWPAPSSAQGYITVIQSCTAHQFRPSRSSSESKTRWLTLCYNSRECHTLVHSLNHFIGWETVKFTEKLKSQTL